LVKTIHVLRDEQLHAPFPLELRQRVMRAIWLRAPEESPADETARPVPLARVFVVHERLELHGLCALPLAILIAIVGNAGVGAAARTGQHEQPTMTRDEVAQGAHHRVPVT